MKPGTWYRSTNASLLKLAKLSSPTSHLVFELLAAVHDHNKSTTQIRDHLETLDHECSRSTFYEALRELREAGLVKVVRRGVYMANLDDEEQLRDVLYPEREELQLKADVSPADRTDDEEEDETVSPEYRTTSPEYRTTSPEYRTINRQDHSNRQLQDNKTRASSDSKDMTGSELSSVDHFESQFSKRGEQQRRQKRETKQLRTWVVKTFTTLYRESLGDMPAADRRWVKPSDYDELTMALLPYSQTTRERVLRKFFNLDKSDGKLFAWVSQKGWRPMAAVWNLDRLLDVIDWPENEDMDQPGRRACNRTRGNAKENRDTREQWKQEQDDELFDTW